MRNAGLGLSRRDLLGAAALLGACSTTRTSARGAPIDAFDGATWEPIPRDIRAAFERIQRGPLVVAMRERNDADIQRFVAAAQEALGPWVGHPEERPEYGVPLDRRRPSYDLLKRALLESIEAFLVAPPWTDPAERGSRHTSRLRVTARAVETLLRTHLATGFTGQFQPRSDLMAAALAGLDYALEMQAPNGVFGYPFREDAASGVAGEAAEYVRRARAQGHDPVWRGWIIDDQNLGGLEFDNAAIGGVLLLGHQVSGREAYLDAAVRAGEWALRREYVHNVNYTTLSAYLFARLYRVTRDQRWLRASHDTFKYVALPTQLPNGRWMDPHNARIQYHSIILRHGLELYLALRQTGDRGAEEMAAALRAGIDNLATQIITHGASNIHEMLATETLSLAKVILGENPAWTEAEYVDLNYFSTPSIRRALADYRLIVPSAVALHCGGEEQDHRRDIDPLERGNRFEFGL